DAEAAMRILAGEVNREPFTGLPTVRLGGRVITSFTPPSFQHVSTEIWYVMPAIAMKRTSLTPLVTRVRPASEVPVKILIGQQSSPPEASTATSAETGEVHVH